MIPKKPSRSLDYSSNDARILDIIEGIFLNWPGSGPGQGIFAVLTFGFLDPKTLSPTPLDS